MLTGEYGTQIIPDNLSEDNVRISPWSIFERLDSEKRIVVFLEGAQQDIEDGECDASFMLRQLQTLQEILAVRLPKGAQGQASAAGVRPALNRRTCIPVLVSRRPMG